MNDFLEIKRHKNKPEQHFCCELLFIKDGYAVLRYRADEPGLIADMRIPAGSTTVAHYWHERPYVAWRMFDSNYCLIGTLFHICTNVCIHDDHLSYDDLLLDIWIAPDGSARILDEDELQICIDAALVSTAELDCIREAQQEIINRHAEIISGLTGFDCMPV